MYNSLINSSVSVKNNIQVNAINLLIELELREGYGVLDISSATIKKVIMKKPDGTMISASATFLNDGQDGLIYYKTVSGDLNQSGVYSIQGYIEMPSFSGYSTITGFTVYDNL